MTGLQELASATRNGSTVLVTEYRGRRGRIGSGTARVDWGKKRGLDAESTAAGRHGALTARSQRRDRQQQHSSSIENINKGRQSAYGNLDGSNNFANTDFPQFFIAPSKAKNLFSSK